MRKPESRTLPRPARRRRCPLRLAARLRRRLPMRLRRRLAARLRAALDLLHKLLTAGAALASILRLLF